MADEWQKRRTAYKIAASAGRETLERAAQAVPPLGRGEWKVLVAVIAFTALYSKVRDRVYVSQLRDFCGLTGSSYVGKILGKLADRQLIRYEPGIGTGKPSTIGLLSPTESSNLHSHFQEDEEAE